MGSQMQLGGLGNSYILILIDGKRIHGDVGGENDLGLIDPQNIERIEFVEGHVLGLVMLPESLRLPIIEESLCVRLCREPSPVAVGVRPVPEVDFPVNSPTSVFLDELALFVFHIFPF